MNQSCLEEWAVLSGPRLRREEAVREAR